MGNAVPRDPTSVGGTRDHAGQAGGRDWNPIRYPSMNPHAIFPAVALAAFSTCSLARQNAELPPLDTSVAAVSLQPAESTTPADAPASTTPPPLHPAYGVEGGQWLGFGYGVADNFTDSTDQYLYFTWSTFLAQDIEMGLEAGAWYFNQPGDNEAGASGVMLFRWHFINRETWSAYAMAGIGVLAATGNVPDTGTSFDLLPRVGVGITKQLTDDGLRLDVGVRWHHISNARIHGDDDNPSRDGAMLYVGLIFPF